MSSSNLVRVAFLKEDAIGETPLVGDFKTARFTNESLSGSPQTTESQQIRSDRLSSGQIVTGLDIGGSLNFELAREAELDEFISSAMMDDWNIVPAVIEDLEYDSISKTLIRSVGDFQNDLEIGDIITTFGFTNEVNNTQHQVIEFVSPTEIKVTSNTTEGALVSEVGSGTSYKRADKVAIGTSKKSFSMEKAFLDLTDKAIVYKGMLVNSFNLNVAYGEIVTGEIGFNGTEYFPASQPSDFITNTRTINPAPTTNSLNGSIDMPILNSSMLGVLEEVDFCIQNLSISLSNNLSAQNCIGKVGPKDYSPGQAKVEVNLSAYLSNDNWTLVSKKLSQEEFALGGMVKNTDGWYGFYLPAVQVSMDDPSSGGANQDISLEMSGSAKVGANGEKSLILYRS